MINYITWIIKMLDYIGTIVSSFIINFFRYLGFFFFFCWNYFIFFIIFSKNQIFITTIIIMTVLNALNFFLGIFFRTISRCSAHIWYLAFSFSEIIMHFNTFLLNFHKAFISNRISRFHFFWSFNWRLNTTDVKNIFLWLLIL